MLAEEIELDENFLSDLEMPSKELPLPNYTFDPEEMSVIPV